jgi:hypothetical protein
LFHIKGERLFYDGMSRGEKWFSLLPQTLTDETRREISYSVGRIVFQVQSREKYAETKRETLKPHVIRLEIAFRSKRD